MIYSKMDTKPDNTSSVYALTGANGRLGRLALDYLIERVPAGQVIAASRRPELLSGYADKGVIVRYADFNDPESLPAAFSGAGRLLIIATNEMPMEKRFDQQSAAIRAASEAGVGYIVNTLLPIKRHEDNNPQSENFSLEKHDSQQFIEELNHSGAVCISLRMNIWMAGVPYFLNALRIKEELMVPEESGKPCWVRHEDYARTAVSVLTGKTLLSGIFDVTGPESLGLDDLAQRWSVLNGRRLVPIVLPAADAIKRLTENGMGFEAAQGLIGYCGMFKLFEVPVSDIVKLTTGVPSGSVDELLRNLTFKP